MVHLLAKDAALCCFIDSAVHHLQQQQQSQSSHAHAAVTATTTAAAMSCVALVQQYLHDAVRRLLSRQRPSHLYDAVRVLLYVQCECLRRVHARDVNDNNNNERTTTTTLSSNTTLPDWCRVHGDVSEAMRRCCANTTALAGVLRLLDTTNTTTTTTTTTTTRSKDDDDDNNKDDNSELASLQQLLQSLSSSSSSSSTTTTTTRLRERAERVLLQPVTLQQLLHRVELLWCVLYACRRVRRLARQRMRLLTPHNVTTTRRRGGRAGGGRGERNTTRSNNSSNNNDKNNSDSDSDSDGDGDNLYFHDTQLLLPVSLVQAVLHDVGVPSLTLRSLMQLCNRAATTTAASATTTTAPVVSVVLIINAATARDDDDDDAEARRARNNRRVDAIDKAVMHYLYDRLTRSVRNTHADASGAPRVTDALHAHHLCCGDAVGDDNDSNNTNKLDSTLAFAGATASTYDVLDPQQLDATTTSSSSSSSSLLSAAAAHVLSLHNRYPHERARHHDDAQLQQQRASYAAFVQSVSIGVDIQLMTLTGAVVGYYLAYLRGASREVCLVSALVGLLCMLVVDATLLLTRIAREDRGRLRQRRRIAQQRRRRLYNNTTNVVPTAATTATIAATAQSKKAQ